MLLDMPLVNQSEKLWALTIKPWGHCNHLFSALQDLQTLPA